MYKQPNKFLNFLVNFNCKLLFQLLKIYSIYFNAYVQQYPNSPLSKIKN